MTRRLRDLPCWLVSAWVAACSRPDSALERVPTRVSAPARASVVERDPCSSSDGCRESGACRSSEGGCQPTQLQDCLDSVACQRDGRCRLLPDAAGARCGSETHADCAGSALCRNEHRCWLAPDAAGDTSCVSAKLRTAQRLPLSEARHGLQGQLVVLLDKRLPAAALTDARGYAAIGEELLAFASVRLEGPPGTVLDELTLYPVVDVAARNLGSGTDTFLATEHVACQAGRFCGWHTAFFEVRAARLQRVRARGANGAECAVETTASFAARWTLRPRAKSGLPEIVSQQEDPLKSLWVERRFAFRDGDWRLDERETSSLQELLAERGNWAGRLD